jgi:glycosyltransferase involved in cell wall biosynthesis
MTERRLVFVSHTANVSGAESMLITLAAAAAATGCEVTVASPRGQISAQLPESIHHLALPKLGLSGETGLRRLVGVATLFSNWIRASIRLKPFTRDTDTRLIVNSLFALPAVRLTLRRRCCTWLVHDIPAERKQRAVVGFSSPAIRRAVAVSSSAATPLRGFGFPVVVSYNGVRQLSEPVPDDLPGRPVVGVLAKLTAWKGQRVILDAMKLVPEADLELAGDHFPGEEDYVEDLRRIAAQPSLAGRVRFLGQCDSHECLSRWIALVSPSIAPEAGPLGILEAMSAGRPVIGTNLGGTAEYLAGGVGILVEPNDPVRLAAAIQRVIADRELRQCLSRRGRLRVSELHDINVTVPKTLRMLTDT